VSASTPVEVNSDREPHLRETLTPVLEMWATRLGRHIDLPVRDMVTDLVGQLRDSGHLHCDHDLTECNVQAMEGEFAERSRQLNEARAQLAHPDLGLDEYQEFALRTAIYPAKWAIIYPSMKLAGEAGEVAEKAAKVLRDEGGYFDTSAKVRIADEVGDVLWYCAATAKDLGFSLDEIAHRNLQKLQSRADRGVLGGSGDNR
jgi:NTP pyrophosphatase (non-canonical NTP hydrolase)